jgi:hypothetical protein
MKGTISILNPETGRSSSSVRRRPHAAKITGSNPVRPTIKIIIIIVNWVFWLLFVVVVCKEIVIMIRFLGKSLKLIMFVSGN